MTRIDGELLDAAEEIHGRQQAGYIDEAMALHDRIKTPDMRQALQAEGFKRQRHWMEDNRPGRIDESVRLPATPPQW